MKKTGKTRTSKAHPLIEAECYVLGDTVIARFLRMDDALRGYRFTKKVEGLEISSDVSPMLYGDMIQIPGENHSCDRGVIARTCGTHSDALAYANRFKKVIEWINANVKTGAPRKFVADTGLVRVM